jgi:hypothetical protein
MVFIYCALCEVPGGTQKWSDVALTHTVQSNEDHPQTTPRLCEGGFSYNLEFIEQGAVKFFYKEPDKKYLRICDLYSLLQTQPCFIPQK